MNIPDELHHQVKVICTLQGKTMTEVVQKFLGEYVEKAKERKLIVLPKKKK